MSPTLTDLQTQARNKIEKATGWPRGTCGYWAAKLDDQQAEQCAHCDDPETAKKIVHALQDKAQAEDGEKAKASFEKETVIGAVAALLVTRGHIERALAGRLTRRMSDEQRRRIVAAQENGGDMQGTIEDVLDVLGPEESEEEKESGGEEGEPLNPPAAETEVASGGDLEESEENSDPPDEAANSASNELAGSNASEDESS